jgi:FkbM family methyltransferase
MPINRETLKRLPVIGYLLRFFHVFIHLPTAWTDIHRELAQLHCSLSELQSFRTRITVELADHSTRLTDHSARLGQHSARLAEDYARSADYSARLTDHSARLTEHESEMVRLAERIDEEHAGFVDCSDKATALGIQLNEFEEGQSELRKSVARFAAQISELNARVEKSEQNLRELPDRTRPPASLPDDHKASISWPVYLGRNRLLVRTERRQLMICPSDDVQITPQMIVQNAWEPALSRVFHLILKPGMAYLEGGAHIGYFTILAAGLVGHTGRVHAFEPMRESYEILDLNTRLNRCKYICELYQAALWSVSGERSLHRYANSLASSTLSDLPEDLEAELGNRLADEVVKTISLDELYNERELKFDFVKLDTEGAETKIFEGGERFFRRSVAGDVVLAIEYNPPAMTGLGIDPTRLFQFFQMFGWRAWNISEDCLLKPVTNPSEVPARDVTNLLVSRQNLPQVLGMPEVSL